jgi:hypothetical protein
VVRKSAPEDGTEVYLYHLGCAAARHVQGRPVGGTVKGSIVDVMWTAGSALVGGVIEGSAVDRRKRRDRCCSTEMLRYRDGVRGKREE